MPRRVIRRSSVVLALLLVIGFVAACDKPAPKITVFGDGKSVIVDATAYQFSGGAPKQWDRNGPTLSVQAGSTLLIDVPRSVANHAWVVNGLTLDSDNNPKVIDGVSSGVVHDNHATRVSTTPVGIGTFVLRIEEYRTGDTPSGLWAITIHTTS